MTVHVCVCAVLQGFMNDGTYMCVCSFAGIHDADLGQSHQKKLTHLTVHPSPPYSSLASLESQQDTDKASLSAFRQHLLRYRRQIRAKLAATQSSPHNTSRDLAARPSSRNFPDAQDKIPHKCIRHPAPTCRRSSTSSNSN
jgi:hypothetical protein